MHGGDRLEALRLFLIIIATFFLAVIIVLGCLVYHDVKNAEQESTFKGALFVSLRTCQHEIKEDYPHGKNEQQLF